MTRDDALEAAIAALTALMPICAEYDDLTTAQIASDAQRALITRRGTRTVGRMERERGLQACNPRR